MQTTYKVGDKVRILDAKKIGYGSKYWNSGDVAEITSVDSDGDLIVDSTKLKGKVMLIGRSEFEYIEKVEESDAKMTQFKVGDKVRVINANASKHRNGDEGVVVSITPLWDVVFIDVDVNGVQQGHYAKNIELISSKPTKNQRLTSAEQAITTLEQKVEAMQAEIDALKAAQKPPVTVIADAIQRYNERTPNEKRKAIIDEAKAFVEETLAEVDEQMGWQTTKIRTYKEYGRLRVEFIVNAEKRTVVALARYGNIPNLPDVLAKGIAKCAPGDVFNEHIGKAIALGRALGLDVSKFEKAAQPSEVVVGHVFDTEPSGGNWTATVTKLGYPGAHDRYGKAFHHSHDSGWLGEKQIKVIDDTEAQY